MPQSALIAGLLLVFTLSVTQEDVQVLGDALGKQPYEKVAPLVRKLEDQLREQQKPPVPEAKQP